jgi:hypothetical protein
MIHKAHNSLHPPACMQELSQLLAVYLSIKSVGQLRQVAALADNSTHFFRGPRLQGSMRIFAALKDNDLYYKGVDSRHRTRPWRKADHHVLRVESLTVSFHEFE